MAETYAGDPVRRLGWFITILLIGGLLMTHVIITAAKSSSGYSDGPAEATAGEGASEGE